MMVALSMQGALSSHKSPSGRKGLITMRLPGDKCKPDMEYKFSVLGGTNNSAAIPWRKTLYLPIDEMIDRLIKWIIDSWPMCASYDGCVCRIRNLGNPTITAQALLCQGSTFPFALGQRESTAFFHVSLTLVLV